MGSSRPAAAGSGSAPRDRRARAPSAPGEGGARALCIRDCDEKPKAQPIFQVEKDVTLLTLLNRIVRAHNGAIWSYSEYRCKGGTQFKLVIVAE